MVLMISSKSQYFNTPQDFKVADAVYNGVTACDARELIDNDGKRKTINFIDTQSSRVVAYVQDNKLTRSDERFFYPQTMNLGGKVYDGIVEASTIPGKYTTFVVNKPDGANNLIRVRKNGSTIDIGELRHRWCVRKIKQPFIRLFKAVC